MQVVLVTGGAGFIGSHTCKALRAAGFLPVSFDNLSRGHRHAVKWGPLQTGDLLDGAALDAAFALHRPVAVLHFAGLAYVGESLLRPHDYYQVNVQGTANLVQAIQRAGGCPLIFSSSCATYGQHDGTPIREGDPQAPINPYGDSKLKAEQVLMAAGQAQGFSWTILRYFNAAGADPDGVIGEEHDPEPHLIPRALLTAAGRLPALDILGDDYPTPDGTCIRDYVHVSDLADAHVLALRRLLAGGASDQFNLGTGSGSSVRQIVDMARLVTGCPIAVRVQPRRAGDPAVLVADASKSMRDLGWSPRRSRLDQQMGDAWRWFTRTTPPPADLSAAAD